MGRRRKLLDYILSGRPDANIPFEQPRALLRSLGFSESIKGSHHKFHREGIEELINLQEIEGGKCKPYQVLPRQGLALIGGGLPPRRILSNSVAA